VPIEEETKTVYRLLIFGTNARYHPFDQSRFFVVFFVVFTFQSIVIALFAFVMVPVTNLGAPRSSRIVVPTEEPEKLQAAVVQSFCK